MNRFDEKFLYKCRMPMMLLSYQDLFKNKGRPSSLKFYVERKDMLSEFIKDKHEFLRFCQEKGISQFIVMNESSDSYWEVKEFF